MAKSFKEIGKKAETLLEQGKEANQMVQSCQARVALASSEVAEARRKLIVVREKDEEGNPTGNVEQAKAQLSMAENQLAASQRALFAARENAERVKQKKTAYVQEIERHKQVEKSNLEKLGRLREKAFGANSAALIEGMTQRLNETEDTRVALLRSMGIDAKPDYVTNKSKGGTDSEWRGVNFATLDSAEQVQNYQGSGSEGLVFGGRISAPVGGGLHAVKSIFETNIFGKRESTQATTINFSGLTIDNSLAADKYFVRGNNFTRFSHFWNNAGQYTYTEAHYFATIDARNIEGIYLNNNEAKNAFMFWNRNVRYSTDSETYFSRIASQIPEIQARLNSGDSAESIRNDPELRACYDSYFDTPISVYKVDDYYYFTDSGRHRCMAAQKLGIDIPVKVIGEYKSNISNLKEVNDFASLSVYMGAKHGVRLSDSIGDLELSIVSDAIEGLESVVGEYPDVGNILTTGITSNSGVMSCTGNKLSFNPGYFKDSKKLVSTCSEMSRKGFWVKNSSPKSIGAHEAAHGVEWALIQANPKYLSVSD